MSKINPFYLILALSFFSLEIIEAQEEKKPIHIGIVMDSQSLGLERTRDVLVSEITDLLSQEFDVTFSDQETYVGDWTAEGIKRAVDQAYADPEVDVVVGIGVMSSNEISQRKEHPKPSFAPFIMNTELQGLSEKEGTSGIHNLNYLTFPTNLIRDFNLYKEFYPFKVLAVLVNGYVLETIPDLAEVIQLFAEEAGINVEVYPVWTSADELLSRLSPNTEAVYSISQTQMSDDEVAKLAQGLIQRKIPAFSLYSKTYIPNGFMASMSPDTDLPRLLRRVALNIQRVLLGEDPGSLEIHVSEADQLTINMKTVKEVGVSPPWSLVQDAVLVNDDYELEEGVHFSFLEAIEYGLKKNLDLAAAKKEVRIGCEEVRLARSNLLPQVGVGATFLGVDKDIAENSFGILPEKSVWSLATASQMIYSNKAIGNFKIEKRLQCARQHEFLSHKLDTVLEIAHAYLNLLRAKTLEDIHRNNLEKTRSHLKLAKQRVDVGAARSSEVYRWESQYANDLTKVTLASYQTKSEETVFKRVLHLPFDVDVHLDEVSLDDPFWADKKDWIVENVTNDYCLGLFIEYSTCEAMTLSEDIKHLQSLICAQAEVLGVAKRAYWTPDIFVNGLFADRFKEWGVGSKTKALLNSTDWAVALNFSFPLYSGGAKSAKKRQACEELKKLDLQLKSLIDMKKQEVRNSSYMIMSSYTAIALSKSAAETADKNLSLVQASYTKGVMPIVDLLDAQNQALVANLETANAVYDYLNDLIIFQRVIGRYDFLVNKGELQRWVEQINAYFNQFRKV